MESQGFEWDTSLWKILFPLLTSLLSDFKHPHCGLCSVSAFQPDSPHILVFLQDIAANIMMRSVLSVCVMFTLLLQGLNAQGKVRLVNGTAPWNGVLEMLYRGTWGQVCIYGIRKQEAQVVCRMLGFNTSHVFTTSLLIDSVSYNYIIFDNLRCTGEETSLEKCSDTEIISDPWCPYVVGITCNSQNIQVRLNFISGQVEIDIGGGHWGTMCVSTDNIARVVCRQLGLPWLGARTFVNEYVDIDGDLSSCLGNETSIAECQDEMSSVGPCLDYTIICSNYLVNIHTNSSRYPLMEETNATLKCASNNQSGVVKYTWPENAGGFPDGSSLIITRVTREHHGSRVKCEAMYSDGEVVSSDTLQLQVYCEYWDPTTMNVMNKAT
ncbi:deleted in malignant brain tumors 1 protein-like [Pomacea canaliculata]|uniref:deleted in malignant brain tumors 1 protein-like n=1 Tax=Pomacea canaliculata TaxID=400727 RepID=UPI000D73E6F9|nr:deleted in malignant brain tumors 1 protein-like [Pomacea canaliculata]